MPAAARLSLAEEVATTLGDPQDAESGDNVEAVLAYVERDLETSNEQLSKAEEKEQFLATRIKKYNSMLKQQDEYIQQLESEQHGNEQHYREQVEKQQKNKEALGKVVDVHIQILKNCKELKHTIAALEMKRAQLTNTTKQFRNFLVMAEEAEREHQAGVESDFEMREMEPLHTMDTVAIDAAAEASSSSGDNVNSLASTEVEHPVLQEQKETDEAKAFTKEESSRGAAGPELQVREVMQIENLKGDLSPMEEERDIQDTNVASRAEVIEK